MIDGEGSIPLFKGNRATNARFVVISNTDHALIAAIEACCQTLGITYKLTDESPAGIRARKYNHWTPIRQVRIYGQANFRILLDEVPIQAPEKLRRLQAIVASYVIPPTIDVNELRHLYYDNGLSLQRISPLMGIGVKTLRRVMRQEGLLLRRSERSLRAWVTRRMHG